MTIKIKQMALSLLGTVLLATTPHLSVAQTKTTKLIVAFPPGGPVDFVARSISEALSKELGQLVIIENKAGANGAIAADYVIKSPPDGNTLWLTSVGAVAINPSLYPKLSYNPQKDLAPVSLVVNNVELLVVNPKNPANNPAEFVANAKNNAQRWPHPVRVACHIWRWSKSPTRPAPIWSMSLTKVQHPRLLM